VAAAGFRSNPNARSARSGAVEAFFAHGTAGGISSAYATMGVVKLDDHACRRMPLPQRRRAGRSP